MKKITLGCGTVITLSQLEEAGISYVPCGQVNGKDQPLLKYAHLLKARKQVTRETYGKKWYGYGIKDANGVQLMTGKPSSRPAPENQFYYYTSLDIEKRMRKEHPSLVDKIVEIYHNGITGTPCEIETKSGGLRLDCYSLYLGKKIPFQNDSGMLFEILAGGSLVRLDARYQIRDGSVLDLPIMEDTETKLDLLSIPTVQSTVSAGIAERTGTKSHRQSVSTKQNSNALITLPVSRQRLLMKTANIEKPQPTHSLQPTQTTRYTSYLSRIPQAPVNHTTLSKSQQHGKRTLMNPPHKALAARNQSGEIVFIGTGTEDTCETLKSTIGDFKSLGELKKHPEVYSLEVAQPVNESVAIAETEVEGGVLLSHSEHIVFSILLKEQGKLVTRELLMKAIQTFGNVDPERLTIMISRLRQKLKNTQYSIYSEYGKGYILRK